LKRRKALLGISLITGGALISFAGFKWFRFNASPDLAILFRKARVIACLADCIIPKSNSPSASECNVPEFIVRMVKENTDVQTQNNFVTGLLELEEYSAALYGKSFLDCGSDVRNKIVSHFSERDKPQPGIVGRIQKKIFGKSFFSTLTEYTVIGYFTSEKGATIALRYSLIPNRYDGCRPYQSGEKAWATY
jgi:hypothetical protein